MKGKFFLFACGVLTGAALFSGNNYVKLRDIGKAVGFNVYFQDGVQVDSKAPYTGEAPAPVQATVQKPTNASAEAVRVNCYKEGPLSVGEGSALMIYPSGIEYTVGTRLLEGQRPVPWQGDRHSYRPGWTVRQGYCYGGGRGRRQRNIH